jgi:hypothetical protein
MKSISIQKLIVFLSLLCSFGHQSLSMEQENPKFFTHEQLLHKVEKLPNHDIYVGAGISKAGEKIYFGLEKINNEENARNWVRLGGGNPEDIVRSTIDRLREIYNHVQNNIEDQSYKSAYGEPQYYNTLTATLTANNDKLKSYFEVGAAETGCQGFGQMIDMSCNAYYDYDTSGNFDVSYNPSGNTYVAYASKNPITGPFFAFGLQEAFSIQEFEDFYGDLIMYMCVRDNTPHPTITNRGNQKNPLCSINGTYKNIAFLFKGFVESAAANYFHNIKYTLIGPNEQMAKQLNATMQTGEMFIGIDDFHLNKYSADIYQKFPPIALSEIGEILHEADCYSYEECHTIKFGTFGKFYTK